MPPRREAEVLGVGSGKFSGKSKINCAGISVILVIVQTRSMNIFENMDVNELAFR